jgi:hypothetical protein
MPAGVVVVELQVSGQAPPDLPFEIDSIVRVESLVDTEPVTPGSSETRTSIYRGIAVDHQVRNGMAVVEGDILLGPANELPPGDANSSKSNERSAIGISSPYSRWPNGVIPYVVDSSVINKSFVTEAIIHWNEKLAGVISLVPRRQENDYVRFMNSSGCSSAVGRAGGEQSVNISSACTIGAVIHEIGHVVGLFHEQSRGDRDSWINITFPNISLSGLFNFMQRLYGANDLGYYGYNSIMHYSSSAFSVNGKDTIETIPRGIPIGQRTGLDISDIAAVRKMYNKSSNEVQISSVPAGLTLLIDGGPVTTPANYSWRAGSVHTISAPSAAGAYGFVRWTNGGSPTHTITVPTTGLTVAAVYAAGPLSTPVPAPAPAPGGTGLPPNTTPGYRVVASVATPGTGTVVLSPSAATYAAGTSVTLSATPADGYCFSSWTGLIRGTANETVLNVRDHYNVTATFIPGAVTPATRNVGILASGTVFVMNTSATTGCGWTIKSGVDWIIVSKSFATSDSPAFAYTVLPNKTGIRRTGTLTVAGTTVTVTQFP